jgi:integrase
LTWDRVDVAEGCIRLDGSHSKNGRPRTAFLSAETTRQLAAYRESVAKQLGAIPGAVFVYVEKGPLRGRRIQKFRKA